MTSRPVLIGVKTDERKYTATADSGNAEDRERRAAADFEKLRQELISLNADETKLNKKQAGVMAMALGIYQRGDWRYSPDCGDNWTYWLSGLRSDEGQKPGGFTAAINPKLWSMMSDGIPKMLAPLDDKPLVLPDGREVNADSLLDGRFSILERLVPFVRGADTPPIHNNPLAQEFVALAFREGTTVRSLAAAIRTRGLSSGRKTGGETKVIMRSDLVTKWTNPESGEILEGELRVYTIVARSGAEERLVELLMSDHVEV